MLFKTKVKNPLALHDPRTRKFGTKHGIRKRRAGAMLLRGLLTTRTLLLSSVCLRSPRGSISACANQVNNPNNDAYWQSRGLASRPDNWESEVAQRAADGRLKAWANDAASRTSGEGAVAGRRTDIIVQAVKASLGTNVQVRKVGSRAKHTDVVSRSDQDFFVDVGDACVSRPQRNSLRDNLVAMLSADDYPRSVLLRQTGILIKLKGTDHVDIIFSKCCFSDKPHPMPAQRFENNPKAQDAVRLIKEGSPQKFKGEGIEMAVLTAQKKGQSTDKLALAAFRQLAKKSQVEEFRAWLWLHKGNPLLKGMIVRRPRGGP